MCGCAGGLVLHFSIRFVVHVALSHLAQRDSAERVSGRMSGESRVMLGRRATRVTRALAVGAIFVITTTSVASTDCAANGVFRRSRLGARLTDRFGLIFVRFLLQDLFAFLRPHNFSILFHSIKDWSEHLTRSTYKLDKASLVSGSPYGSRERPQQHLLLLIVPRRYLM